MRKIDASLLAIAQEEVLIDAFSTHWIKYVVPLLLYLLIISAAIAVLLFARINVGSADLLAHVAFISGIVLLTFIHHWFYHRVLSEGMVDVVITNKRLIFLQDSLWLYDNMHEVTIERIRAVEARKVGFACNLCRYGSLWFDTGGSDTESSIIPLVPHPHSKAKKITQLLNMK